MSSALDIRHFALVRPDVRAQLGGVALTLLALGLIGAAGEEIGWRGFLLPKLVAGGVKHPYLVTGIVWSLWHLPLIAFGDLYQTDSPLLMPIVYGLGIIAMSFTFSELRMASGSVWVAAVVHAANNFFFQFAVPALILTEPGSHAALWNIVGGDTGLSVALLYAGTYMVFLRASRRRGVSRAAKSV